MIKVIKLVISVLICEGAGFLGSIFTAPAIPKWYALIEKPGFNPPNWIFMPVWTILFFLMGVSLYLVWEKKAAVSVSSRDAGAKFWNPISAKFWAGSWKEENVIMVFALQLFLNVLWSAIFFGLKAPDLAFFEILMLWVAIIYTIANFHRVSKAAAFLLLPYLLWVSFAAVLNLCIWLLNWGSLTVFHI